VTEIATSAAPHPFADPHGWCRDTVDPNLVQHGPPVRVPEPSGRTVWLVTRYDEVRFVLGDPRFGREPMLQFESPKACPGFYSRATILSTCGPKDHTRLRRVFNDGLNTTGAAEWRPLAESLVDNYLDRISKAGSSADLVGQFFDPLLLELLSEIIGVPVADRHRLHRWAAVFHSTVASSDQYEAGMVQTEEYFDDLVRQRRQHPAADLISHGLDVANQRGDVTDWDVASLVAGIFSTGIPALSGQLQISTYMLLRRPEVVSILREQPQLLGRAVSELLRYTPLIVGPLRARYVLQDVEVGGVVLRQGDLVLPSVGAANLDPHAFPNPYDFDIMRDRSPILAFGFGLHFCQAAQFVRMMLTTVVSALTTRFPGIRITVSDEALRWDPERRTRGFYEMPVSW